jgi:cell division protein FtsL
MKRFFKFIFIIIILAAVALIAYDYHMRNSGLRNRFEYENQKEKLGVEYGNSPIEDMIENGKERRKKRRKKRSKKLKQFFD